MTLLLPTHASASDHAGYFRRFGETGQVVASVDGSMREVYIRAADATLIPVELTITRAVIGGGNVVVASIADLRPVKALQQVRAAVTWARGGAPRGTRARSLDAHPAHLKYACTSPRSCRKRRKRASALQRRRWIAGSSWRTFSTSCGRRCTTSCSRCLASRRTSMTWSRHLDPLCRFFR